MALTVLTDGSLAENTRTLTWTIPALAVGDVVVVRAMTWDGTIPLSTPAGTGLTFTQRVVRTTSAKCYLSIWTAVAAASGTNVVVTCAQPGGGNAEHTGVLVVCPAADGYSLADTPNTTSTVQASSGTLPQATLAGTAGNLGLGMIGDWNGAAWTSRAYLGDDTVEDLGAHDDTSQLYFHQTLTGASTAIGLSAPVGTGWNLAAIEILKSEGGGEDPGEGTAAGTWGFTGTATGKREPKATATGSLAWAGAATGKRTPKAIGTGTVAWTGAATGTTTRTGTATGTWGYTGTATGHTYRSGTAAGTWGYGGTAHGRAPGIDIPEGTATGTWAWTGTATGKRAPKATAIGTTAWTGAATSRSGTAAGTWAWVGTASGIAGPAPEAVHRVLTARMDPPAHTATAGPPAHTARPDRPAHT